MIVKTVHRKSWKIWGALGGGGERFTRYGGVLHHRFFFIRINVFPKIGHYQFFWKKVENISVSVLLVFSFFISLFYQFEKSIRLYAFSKAFSLLLSGFLKLYQFYDISFSKNVSVFFLSVCQFYQFKLIKTDKF